MRRCPTYLIDPPPLFLPHHQTPIDQPPKSVTVRRLRCRRPRMPITPTRDSHRDTPPCVARILKRRVRVRQRKQCRSQRPDVNLLVESLARRRFKEFWSSVGHGGVFGGEILLEEGFLAGTDVDAGGETGAEIHEDGRLAVVGDHDVAERREERRRQGHARQETRQQR